MKNYASALLFVSILCVSVSVRADIVANWTFETSVPTTSGPHAAEFSANAGSSFASTNSGGTISNPAGNGSNESFSSNGWADTEYYQFLTATTGFNGILVSYAQAASSTGPANFQFQYTTDGLAYTNFGSVYAGPTSDFTTTANPLNVLNYDLTSISGLNNNPNAGFRIAVSGNTAENGSPIGSTGSFRVDDFLVQTSAVPEPTSLLLLSCSVVAITMASRRKRN